MDIQEIKQLIKIVEKSDIGELEVEEDGRKIRIAKSSKVAFSPGAGNGMINPVFLPSPSPIIPSQADVSAVAAAAPAAKTGAPETTDADKYYEVRSPMVGTFYRSPSPDAAPYVEVGDQVSPGSKLCIIEAMKLMNEIESEFSGRIAKIVVNNAQAVEFNQVLFLIEK
jgi:acetyl-CoA carboxylase biotin carboxyl carrier protein